MAAVLLLSLCGLILGVSTQCTSNLNCSLNGICTGGACVCDVPWTGPRCGVLQVAAAKPGG
jgi:hypothetical protein